jgi:hypothetical protein
VRMVFRLLRYATYPFLGLSMLMFAGMTFGAAFVTDFTIENRTDTALIVTPVGTWGAGNRAPLPVKMLAFPPLPALRGGGYRLVPGESVTVQYDMDDINFSEIVVQVEPGRTLQLVTDPTPTANQYHGPLQRHYVIDDLARLEPTPAPVQAAAQLADRQWVVVCVMDSLLFGPWLAYALMTWLSRRWQRRQTPNQTPNLTGVA